MGSSDVSRCEYVCVRRTNFLVVADLKLGASIKTLKMVYVYVCAQCCAFRANVCQMWYVARRIVE